MRGSEVKPGKSQNRSAQRHINTGFVVGGLLMLLTYLVAQHFAVGAPHGNDESFISPRHGSILFFAEIVSLPS
jgi:hypothetical protein